MPYTRTWNAAYEAAPADSDNVSAGAGEVRNFRTDVRERMEKDHYMDITGTDADHGEHTKVTLRVGSAPTHAADKGILYAKDVSSKAEMFYIDEAGDEVQLTSGGATAVIPTGTKMLFYADVAPTGWTIDNTLNDKVVFVTSGSAAGGEVGGGAHSTGTWTQPSHTHTGPSHTHTVTHSGWTAVGTAGASGVLAVHGADPSLAAVHRASAAIASGASGTAASGASATAATWRPAAYCCIVCAKA